MVPRETMEVEAAGVEATMTGGTLSEFNVISNMCMFVLFVVQGI